MCNDVNKGCEKQNAEDDAGPTIPRDEKMFITALRESSFPSTNSVLMMDNGSFARITGGLHHVTIVENTVFNSHFARRQR